MRLTEVVEAANENHLAPWTELLKTHDIESTPLTPFIDGELLRNKHLNVDGSKIESTGFAYEVPEVRPRQAAARRRPLAHAVGCVCARAAGRGQHPRLRGHVREAQGLPRQREGVFVG